VRDRPLSGLVPPVAPVTSLRLARCACASDDSRTVAYAPRHRGAMRTVRLRRSTLCPLSSVVGRQSSVVSRRRSSVVAAMPVEVSCARCCGGGCVAHFSRKPMLRRRIGRSVSPSRSPAGWRGDECFTTPHRVACACSVGIAMPDDCRAECLFQALSSLRMRRPITHVDGRVGKRSVLCASPPRRTSEIGRDKSMSAC